jgi:ribonuclease Z
VSSKSPPDLTAHHWTLRTAHAVLVPVKVTFLGTSGSFPTAARNVTSHCVWVKGETILLDCGEGTQRQLRRSSHRFGVDRIFLSHLHLDHCLGLAGFIGTMGLLQRTEPLRVYTPAGTRKRVEDLVGERDFPIDLVELDDGAEIRGDGFKIVAARVEHSGPALAFRIEENVRLGRVDVAKAKAVGIEPGPLMGQLIRDGKVEINGRTVLAETCVGPPRPGRSVVYSGDTRPCRAVAKLAEGADLLIHESTYTNEFQDEADMRRHSTSTGAAQVAREAKVRRLALTHISQRHQEPDELRKLVNEARAIFKECWAPNDLEEIEIPHVEP